MKLRSTVFLVLTKISYVAEIFKNNVLKCWTRQYYCCIKATTTLVLKENIYDRSPPTTLHSGYHGVDCVPLSSSDDISHLRIPIYDLNGTSPAADDLSNGVRIRTDFINSFINNSSR